MNKTEIISYLRSNKMDIQRSKASLFICAIVYDSYANSRSIHGINCSPTFCYLDWQNLRSFHQMISDENINKVAKSIYLKYLKNPNSLNKKIRIHHKLTDELDKMWANYINIKKSQKEISDKEFLVIYKKMVKTITNWWRYGVIGEDKGRVIELEVVPKFAKRHNISTKKAQDIINVLSHPKEQAVFNRERVDFLETCLYILKKQKNSREPCRDIGKTLTDKVLEQRIKKYLKNNFWIKSDFFEAREITPSSLLKDMISEISKRSEKEISNELKQIELSFKKIEKQKKGLLKKIKLSSEDKKDLYFATRTIYWIDQRKLGMMKHIYYMLMILGDIEERFNLDHCKLSPYTMEEIGDFLAHNKKINPTETELRHKGVFLSFEEGKKVKIFYSEDAKELFDVAMHTEEKEVKGVVASVAKEKVFQGIARIVFDPGDDKFKEGEILVTSMTRVEYVPLMRKAKAIITDEGGMACHAAIISRELGITAIIGTKVASKILKDGDLVEVDANKGIVRALKKI